MHWSLPYITNVFECSFRAFTHCTFSSWWQLCSRHCSNCAAAFPIPPSRYSTTTTTTLQNASSMGVERNGHMISLGTKMGSLMLRIWLQFERSHDDKKAATPFALINLARGSEKLDSMHALSRIWSFIRFWYSTLGICLCGGVSLLFLQKSLKGILFSVQK